MNINKIITWILITFIILLIILSYTSNNENVNLKDIDKNINFNKINNIKDKSTNTYTDIKDSILYGSDNRKLPVDAYFCLEENCEYQINDLIKSSKKSIDCAIYDISLDAISDSLIEVSKENIDVRIVTDYHNSSKTNSNIGKIKAANISVITNPNDKEYMHNKFCVFDNETVIIGSLNFTLNGNYKNNNDILVIKDKELANKYTQKINSFFSGEFSLDIEDEIEENKIANSEIYFCPENNCAYHFMKFLDNSENIDCMFFSFTLDDVTDLIVSKNLNARFILEEKNIDQYSEYYSLKENNIPVILDKNPYNMHHKFCVFDDDIVMTGSMNLSKNGTEINDESIIFIKDENIAKEYKNYFEKYWNKWK